jgi:NitT/TauT family transport system substrate-binding protein
VNKRLAIKAILWLTMCLRVCLPAWGQRTASTIRVGAFPNITHSQAMVGKANGFFQRALGPGVKIEWKTFNAGPAAIEALFAGAIDMTYIGPNPAIQGYVRSNGEALRIIAGATSGGASLVVRRESRSLKTSTAGKSPRRNREIRRTSRCVPGFWRMA